MILLYLILISAVHSKYKPTWDSLESRPLPEWFDNDKFGIFCHWGVYSVPGYKSEWLWWYWKGQNDTDSRQYIADNFPPRTEYPDFAVDFKAEQFNADEFASVVKSSGAKYFVFTSKHHEGFTMWPSKTSWNWNAVDIGPKKDIVGALQKSMTSAGITFGLYFSQYDWFHPLYLLDQKENSTLYPKLISVPQMHEIVLHYNPSIIWSDGDWDMSEEYWESKEFLAWLYNESPVSDTVVVNDRWGKGVMGVHGGFLTNSDHFDPGVLQPRKWENCLTLDKKSWGHRRDIKHEDVHTAVELIEQLARTISCGGNMLLNIGPTKEGTIPLIFQDRLKEIGIFVNASHEAIFGTKPWIHQNDTHNTWYTSRYRNPELMGHEEIFNKQKEKQTLIYGFILSPDKEKDMLLKNVKTTKSTIVTFLGTNRSFYAPESSSTLTIPQKTIPWEILPRRDVIVIRIEYAASSNHNPLRHLSKKGMEKKNKRQSTYSN